MMLSGFSLTGLRAFVTGSSRGIGASIAFQLAVAGCDVAITSRTKNSLREVSSRIRNLGREALEIELDTTDLTNIESAVEQAERELGPIDIFVNNAGVNVPSPALEVTEAEWDAVHSTNLKGVFFCSQAIGRRMISRGKGKIINISSAAGLIPANDRAAYCSSKAGVIMLTKELALEWAEYGVTVNAVAPTFVETELAAQTLEQPGMRELWTGRIPLGRLASTQDVSAATVYLASPEASFLTGVVLPVDGGLTMK